jgi:hypothetical protein
MSATYREFRTATREFELTDGKHCFAYGEVRYGFTITPPRKAVTWANADKGFATAEGAVVDIESIEYRTHPSHEWEHAKSQLYDMLSEVPNAWLLGQIEEQEA